MSEPLRIMVATPCYGGTLTTGYVHGLMDAARVLGQEGIPFVEFFNNADSLVTRARNILVATFLGDPSFSHLMWIDSDIGFSGADLLRLIRANRPIAAGLYPLKTDGWQPQGLNEPLPKGTTREEFRALYAAYPANMHPAGWVVDADGFIDAIDAPTGFMLIKREVLVAFMEAYPFLKCVLTGTGSPEESRFHYDFFGTGVDPNTGVYLSEDYVFCRRALKLGYRIAIDAQSNLTHQGVAVYTGNLAKSLAVNRRLPNPL